MDGLRATIRRCKIKLTETQGLKSQLQNVVEHLQASIGEREGDEQDIGYLNRLATLRVSEAELQRLQDFEARLESNIQEIQVEIEVQSQRLDKLREENRAWRARKEDEMYQKRQKQQSENERSTQDNDQEGDAACEEGGSKSQPCDHQDIWYRTSGQHKCSQCGVAQRRFAHKCTGCKTMACVGCMGVLNGEGY